MLKIAFVAVALLGTTASAFASDATFDQRYLAPVATAAPQAKPEASRPTCSCVHHAAAVK
jgi:predicted outer membrane protein